MILTKNNFSVLLSATTIFLCLNCSPKNDCSIAECFNHSTEWKQDTSGCLGIRAQYLDKCIFAPDGRNNYYLSGKSKKCILAALGKPNLITDDGNTLIYNVIQKDCSKDSTTLVANIEIYIKNGLVDSHWFVVFD